jgi:Activator of Hsp90 ATPase homolog 1-like protein
MILTATRIEDLVIQIDKEIHVRASLETTFDAMLTQLGPGNTTPDGSPMPLKVEPWPGGRWYRDLGNNQGHFWANVQAIKRPTLLEFAGPLMTSFPVTHNVQFRLKEVEGGTVISFHHYAFGVLIGLEDFRKGVNVGWTHITETIRKLAESQSTRH